MIRRRESTFKPRLEALEDRCVLSAGALDPTFGSGGLVVSNLGSTTDSAFDLVIQSDNKIVTAGRTSPGLNSDFALVRYNSNGTLDTSFGSNGRAVTNFKSGSYDAAYAIAQQADGKFVAAGYATSGRGDQEFALARYHSNGKLDTSFGSKGKVVTTISRDDDGAAALAIQADGKIVVAGYKAGYTGSADFVVARYNVNGSLDASFGSSGIVITDFGGTDDGAWKVAIQTDGKIVVAGSVGGAGFGLARYNPNGSLDVTFGSQGKVTTVIPGDPYATGNGIAIQADGRIVVGGSFIDRLASNNGGIALARYQTNGVLDPSFGAAGIVTILKPSDIVAFSLAMQSDGKFILAGQNGKVTGPDFVLARVNGLDGSLDTSFGTAGLVTTDFGPTFGVSGSLDRAEAVRVQADGKIVAVGSFTNPVNDSADIALARYLGAEPLLAARAAPNPTATVLTDSLVQPLLAEAIARWQAAGLNTTSPGNIQIHITDLGGATLGLASGSTIWLDDNAAGWGWFVDSTPGDDSEFTTRGNQGEHNHMDLLTVLMHEIGHLLGKDHEAEGLMAETLAAGTRSTPDASTLSDAVFATDWDAML